MLSIKNVTEKVHSEIKQKKTKFQNANGYLKSYSSGFVSVMILLVGLFNWALALFIFVFKCQKIQVLPFYYGRIGMCCVFAMLRKKTVMQL